MVRQVRDAVSVGDEVVEIKRGPLTVAPGAAGPGDGDPFAPRGRRMHRSRLDPSIRTDPPVDDQDPADRKVAGHASHRGREVLHRGHVANRGEETGHRIEATVKLKRPHVTLDESDLWKSLPSLFEHSGVDVETHDVVVIEKVLEVSAGPARDVE